MNKSLSIILFTIVRILCCTLFFNQVNAQPTIELTNPEQKSIHIVHTDSPPIIDGILDDEVWNSAAFINDLHQANPVEYATPSEKTEIYLLYDQDSLYVGVRLFMDDPDLISANILRQAAKVILPF